MTRIETACYALLAAAFVLAGILVVQLNARFTAEAQASLVIARDNFTLMTARTRQNEEALFVLDNSNGRLLIYRLNLAGRRKQLERVGAFHVEALFKKGSAGGAGRGRDRGR